MTFSVAVTLPAKNGGFKITFSNNGAGCASTHNGVGKSSEISFETKREKDFSTKNLTAKFQNSRGHLSPVSDAHASTSVVPKLR